MPMYPYHNNMDKSSVVLISMSVVIILFIIYKHISYNNIDSINYIDPVDTDILESIDQYKNNNQMSDPLSNSGWVVFVSNGCHFCTQQKEVLKTLFPYFTNFFENNNGAARVVPTWVNTRTGQVVPGFQSVESLRKMAGVV